MPGERGGILGEREGSKDEDDIEAQDDNELLGREERKRDSIHLDIESSHCKCRGGKRVSILLSDERMRDGYPSLLILGRETEKPSAVKSVLRKNYQETEMKQRTTSHSVTIDNLHMSQER